MRATPPARADTTPGRITAAIDGSRELQITDAPGIGWPLLSYTVAPNIALSPIATSSTLSGVATTCAANCVTETIVVSAAPELLATTRAAPTVWAVTNPVPLTVATAGSSDVQVTTAPATACELWSSTAALSCDVSPSAPSVTLSGVETTRATSCATST